MCQSAHGNMVQDTFLGATLLTDNLKRSFQLSSYSRGISRGLNSNVEAGGTARWR